MYVFMYLSLIIWYSTWAIVLRNVLRCHDMLHVVVAGQLGLKSSRPLSQLGPGSTPPESARPSVFSEHIWYMFCFLYMYNHSD